MLANIVLAQWTFSPFQEDTSGAYRHLIGIPKALLPARPDNGDTILDYWWNALKRWGVLVGPRKFTELLWSAYLWKCILFHFPWGDLVPFPWGLIINYTSCFTMKFWKFYDFLFLYFLYCVSLPSVFYCHHVDDHCYENDLSREAIELIFPCSRQQFSEVYLVTNADK